VQFMKAGIMEVPDVFVVNKCDEQALARRSLLELRSVLDLVRPGAGQAPVRVLQTSAKTGLGIDELAAYLAEEASQPVDRAARIRQEAFFLRKAIAERYGRFGLEQLETVLAAHEGARWDYDAAEREALEATRARIR